MQETMQETPKQSDIEVDANRSEPQKLEPPYPWRELSDEEIKSLIPYAHVDAVIRTQFKEKDNVR